MYGEAWDAHCAPMRGFMNQATSIRYNIHTYMRVRVKIRYKNVLPCLIFIYRFRLVGSPSDWKNASITFYEGEFYNGKDQSFFRDASSFSMNDFGR